MKICMLSQELVLLRFPRQVLHAHKLLWPAMSLLQDCSGTISIDFFLSFGSYEQLPPTMVLNEHLTIDIFVYKWRETFQQ